jgi:hypothetical protein
MAHPHTSIRRGSTSEAHAGSGVPARIRLYPERFTLAEGVRSEQARLSCLPRQALLAVFRSLNRRATRIREPHFLGA